MVVNDEVKQERNAQLVRAHADLVLAQTRVVAAAANLDEAQVLLVATAQEHGQALQHELEVHWQYHDLQRKVQQEDPESFELFVNGEL